MTFGMSSKTIVVTPIIPQRVLKISRSPRTDRFAAKQACTQKTIHCVAWSSQHG